MLEPKWHGHFGNMIPTTHCLLSASSTQVQIKNWAGTVSERILCVYCVSMPSRLSVCLYVCMYLRMYACTYVCMDGWMDGMGWMCKRFCEKNALSLCTNDSTEIGYCMVSCFKLMKNGKKLLKAEIVQTNINKICLF